MFDKKADRVDRPPLYVDPDDVLNEATWILGDLMSECMPFRTEEEEDALCEKAARMALKLRRSVQRECAEPQ
jgi:hypothetical protein